MGNNTSDNSSPAQSAISVADDDDNEDEDRNATGDAKDTTTGNISYDETDDDSEINSESLSSSTEEEIVKNNNANTNVKKLPNFDSLYSTASITRLTNSFPNKEKPNEIATQYQSLLRYFENRYSRGDITIKKAQFCDAVIKWGLSEKDTFRLFALFDTEGRQEIHVPSAMECLRNNLLDFGKLDCGMQLPIQAYGHCNLVPGFADIRGDGIDVRDYEHCVGTFNDQAKLSIDVLPLIPDIAFDAIFRLRKFIIDRWLDNELFHAHLIVTNVPQTTSGVEWESTKSTWPQPSKSSKDETERQEVSIHGMPPGARVLKCCYKTTSVSSNKKDAQKLMDGDPRTYWQSNGSHGSHWILITLKEYVVVTNLSIDVSSNDQNFMPNLVTVSAGNSTNDLRPITKQPITIASTIVGTFKLMGDLATSYRFIRINIQRCHGDGCDTRVRGVKVEGYRLPKMMENTRSSELEEAGILWYLNILTSTVEACLPVAPTLKRMIIEHSTTFAQRLSPLSLTGCEEFKATKTSSILLTPAVLDAAESSLERILKDSDDSLSVDGIRVLSKLALARFKTNSILRLVRYLLELKSDLPKNVADELKESMETTMTSLFLARSTKIPCDVVFINGTLIRPSLSTERQMTSSLGEDRMEIILRPQAVGTKMMLTRMIINVSSTPFEAPTSGTIYALFIDNPNEAIGSDNLSTDDPRVKVIGHFERNPGETSVEVFLEPYKCSSVIVRMRRPANDRRIVIPSVYCYGFWNGEKVGKKMTRSVGWSDVKEQGTNLDLAGRLMLFMDTVQTVTAHDSNVISACQTTVDLDILNSCFQSIVEKPNTSWTLKTILLQLVDHLIRRGVAFRSGGNDQSASRNGISSSLFALTKCQEEPESALSLSVAMNIISNGVTIFYPDEMERKNAFLALLPNVGTWPNGSVEEVSFISLCKYFSTSTAPSLINLPYGTYDQGIKRIYVEVEGQFEKLYSAYVACVISDMKLRNFDTMEKTNSHILASTINIQHLHLFGWYALTKKRIDKAMEENGRIAQRAVHFAHDAMVAKIVLIALRQLAKLLSNMLDAEITNADISKKTLLIGKCTTIGTAFNSIFQMAISAVDQMTQPVLIHDIMNNWCPIIENARIMDTFSAAVDIESKIERTGLGEDLVTLKRWSDIESDHPYEAQRHVQKLFHQPGAVVFEIEMNARCNLDANDYVAFVSDRGLKSIVNKKMLETKKTGPKRLAILSRDKLQFIFHSDVRTSSTKSWGYSFSVVAKGVAEPVINSWTADLYLILTQLGGHLLAKGVELFEKHELEPDISMTLEPPNPVVPLLKDVGSFLRVLCTEQSASPVSPMIGLTFLGPSLNRVANVMKDSGILQGTKLEAMKDVLPALMEHWIEVVSCAKSLASASDRHFWALHVLHLFPMWYFNDACPKLNIRHMDVNRIVQSILETAIDQQEILKKKTQDLKEEIIDADCYRLFQDWLAIVRPTSPGKPPTLSDLMFHKWRMNLLSSSQRPDERRRAKLFVSQYSELLNRNFVCDGCNQPITGVRYRCLDCMDVDLCPPCLAIGEGPLGHASNHRLVAFSFYCNNCGGFIIGSRFHCAVCQDYDLCFGCMLNARDTIQDGGENPTGHTREHRYITHPPICVKAVDNDIQSMTEYLSNYSWLLATKLTLRLSTVDAKSMDEWKNAFNSNLMQMAKRQFSNGSNGRVNGASDSNDSWMWTNRLMIAEGLNSERILGLIAINCALSSSESSQIRDALTMTYGMIKSDHNIGRAYVDHFALYLLGKLCLIAGPVNADRILNQCSKTPVDEAEPGYLTLSFLFVFGSSLSLATYSQLPSAVAWIFAKFLQHPKWKAITARYLEMKMAGREETLPAETVYAYLIFTDHLTGMNHGSEVEFTNARGIRERGIIMDVVGDKGLFKILSTTRRRLQLVKASDIGRCLPLFIGKDARRLIELTHLQSDAELNITSVADDQAWSKLEYEQLFSAALSMKALTTALMEESEPIKCIEELYGADFVKDLMGIARRSTTLPLGNRAVIVEKVLMNALCKNSFRFNDTSNDKALEKNDEELLADVPEYMRNCLRKWVSEYSVPLSMLVPVYNMKNDDTARLLHEIRSRVFPRSATLHSQEMAFRSACVQRLIWIKMRCQSKLPHQTPPTDYGFHTPPIIGTRPEDDELRVEMAFDMEEIVSSFETKFTNDERQDEDGDMVDETAAMYLQDDLEKDGVSRNVLLRRLSTALAVLNARKLLSELIVRWPKDIPLQRLGLANYGLQLSFVDLLRLTPDCSSNITRCQEIIFDHASKDSIKELAYYCCQLLQEGMDEIITRNYVGPVSKEVIKIPKASCLSICVTTEADGELHYNGEEIKDWIERTSVEHPINTSLNTNEVQIDFQPERGFIGHKLDLKIVGKNFRYFDTGHSMLRLLFDAMRQEGMYTRPFIGQLWVWLLYVGCRSTGQQRLKSIDLLCHLLSVLDKEKPGHESLPIDVRLAAPLWKFLNDLNSACAEKNLQCIPAIGRRISELFFVLERLAVKWNEQEKLAVAKCDYRPIIRTYAHGCRIVANICASIGLENEITAVLQAMAAEAALKIDTKEKKNGANNTEATFDLDSDDGQLSDLLCGDDTEDAESEDSDEDEEETGDLYSDTSMEL